MLSVYLMNIRGVTNSWAGKMNESNPPGVIRSHVPPVGGGIYAGLEHCCQVSIAGRNLGLLTIERL